MNCLYYISKEYFISESLRSVIVLRLDEDCTTSRNLAMTKGKELQYGKTMHGEGLIFVMNMMMVSYRGDACVLTLTAGVPMGSRGDLLVSEPLGQTDMLPFESL